MNQLNHLTDFTAVLADYHLSDSALKTLKQTRLVLISGPTGGGRNTLISNLLKTGDYHLIVSDTTREPRENNGVMEQSGREYWFRSETDLLKDLRAGEFLEAEVIHGQQVSGISIRELLRANEADEIAINDVEIGGLTNVLKLKPDTLAILALPPSFEEWQRRFLSRGVLPADEQRRRLQTAVRIFQAALENNDFKFVINDDLDEATAQVHAMAKLQIIDPEVQQKARNLAEQLLLETNSVLHQA